MKYLFLLTLIFVIGCQDSKKSKAKKALGPDELIDRDSMILMPQVQGIEVSGSNFHKEDDLNIAEDIKIIESSTGKAVDEFSMVDWGPVAFSSGSDALIVYPDEEIEIIYQISNNKVVRTSKCTFKPIENESKFEHYLKLARAAKPDWEAIYFGIFRLAASGHKPSYDFFMNSNEEAKKLLAHAESAASTESIYRVLNFMKKNGCNW